MNFDEWLEKTYPGARDPFVYRQLTGYIESLKEAYEAGQQSKQDENKRLREVIKKLANGIKAVRALIDESEGVYGLHLNGDLVSWGELQEGGWLEEWLICFNIAEDYLPAPPEEG